VHSDTRQSLEIDIGAAFNNALCRSNSIIRLQLNHLKLSLIGSFFSVVLLVNGLVFVELLYFGF
jgi:hypothetical protein